MQRLGDELGEFVGDVFGSLRFAVWQGRAGDDLRGLMLDGRRKSIQPMAARACRTPATARDGSRRRNGRPVPMSSKFVFQRVRPAGPVIRSAHLGQDLPETWLIAEWAAGADEPVKYWPSNLPERTAKRTLIRLAKLRRRIEHDYREIKTGLGLDHYEGRTWQGFHHHHVTLVSAAHAFLTLQRLDPNPCAAMTLYAAHLRNRIPASPTATPKTMTKH